jgi:hypothetical protein
MNMEIVAFRKRIAAELGGGSQLCAFSLILEGRSALQETWPVGMPRQQNLARVPNV